MKFSMKTKVRYLWHETGSNVRNREIFKNGVQNKLHKL